MQMAVKNKNEIRQFDAKVDAALWLSERGWYVLPLFPPAENGTCSCPEGAECRTPGKHPLTRLVPQGHLNATKDASTIRQWWADWPDANIGIALAKSGLVVIGPDSPGWLKEFKQRGLPTTFTVQSGGGEGHQHYYYRRPADCPHTRICKSAEYDLISDGLAVGPFSLHKSGRQYELVNAMPDLPLAPIWAVEMLVEQEAQKLKSVPVMFDDIDEDKARAVYERVKAYLPDYIKQTVECGPHAYNDDEPQPDRSKIDYSVCCWLVRQGLSSAEIRAIYRIFPVGMEGKYAERGDGYLATTIGNARSDTGIAEPGSKNEEPLAQTNAQPSQSQPTIVDVPKSGVTEYRVAEALAKLYGQDLRYIPSQKEWYVWDGQRWIVDEEAGTVSRLAVETARAMQKQIFDKITDPDLRMRRMGEATRMENEPKVRGIVKLTQTVTGMTAPIEDFDAKPWLLNCANGTVDLQTGMLREHRREDYLTQIISLPYDPKARAPRWEKFLHEIFLNDEELISYVQRVVGYCLTGDNSERAFFIAYGHGRNGKSIFLEVLRAVMGDYVAALDPQALLKHRDRPHPSDIAMLRGKRLAYAQETPEGHRLNEALIKALTGGDTVTVRKMHKNPFELRPTFKLWMSTNSKPIIRESGTALWDRIKLIPFSYTVPKGQEVRRHELLDRFAKVEGSGVLLWAVAGFGAYLEDGLREPKKVQEATNDYKVEMDVLGRFIEDCCDTGAGHWASTASLYIEYQEWCRNNGENAWTKGGFSKALGERGFEDKRQNGARGWKGLQLKSQRFSQTRSEPVSITD